MTFYPALRTHHKNGKRKEKTADFPDNFQVFNLFFFNLNFFLRLHATFFITLGKSPCTKKKPMHRKKQNYFIEPFIEIVHTCSLPKCSSTRPASTSTRNIDFKIFSVWQLNIDLHIFLLFNQQVEQLYSIFLPFGFFLTLY